MRRITLTVADERFIPRNFNIPFDPFMRHFERYIQCVKLLGYTGNNQRWLDCACGAGYATNFLTNFSEEVVGYDIDKTAIKYANENYKNNNCQFVAAISKSIKPFDVIFSVETIEHMPKNNANAFLKDLYFALKDDGHMIITTPIVKQTNNNPINKFHYIEYSDADFKNLLTSSGFEIVESKFIKTTFTDGETKDQGYYKCRKTL